jgi:hypothetical protein
LAQGQGGVEFQPADILKYFEELKRGPNTEIETKDFFEMASKYKQVVLPEKKGTGQNRKDHASHICRQTGSQ